MQLPAIIRQSAFRLFMFLLVFPLLSACSDNATLMRIPADADWVAYADLRKLAIQSFSLQDLLKGKTGEKPQTENKNGEEIKWDETGIDILSKIVIFEKSKDEFGKSLIFLIPISDREDFQAFSLKNWNLRPAEDLGPDWLSNDTISIYIDKKMAIGIHSADKLPLETIRAQIDLVRNLKEEENLIKKSEWFKSLTKEEKSVTIWADIGKIMDASGSLFQADFLRGELCGSMDFQTGRMIADAKIRRNETEKTSSIFGRPLGAELMNSCMAGNSAQAFLALSLSVKNLLAIADQNPLAQRGNIFLASYGLSRDDLEKELSGEIAVHSVADGSKDSSAKVGIRLLIGTRQQAGAILEKISRAGQIIPDQNGSFLIPSASGYMVSGKANAIEISPDWYKPGSENNLEAGKFALETPSFLAGRVSMEALEENNMLKDDADLRELSKIWKSFKFQLGNPEPEVTGMNLIMDCADDGHSSLLAMLETIRSSLKRRPRSNQQDNLFPSVF